MLRANMNIFTDHTNATVQGKKKKRNQKKKKNFQKKKLKKYTIIIYLQILLGAIGVVPIGNLVQTCKFSYTTQIC